MSSAQRWGITIFAVLAALIAAEGAGLAQSPWKQGTPFPQPDEELYGVTCNGKLYVIGGFGGGKGRGVNFEFDPATDKWKQGKSMPRPAHHAALASANGKIYVLGGFIAPETKGIPLGAAWEPIDNAWEYDPAADSWKALAPLPGKSGAAVAVEVGGKIHLIGGVTTVEAAKEPFLTMMGPCRVLATNTVYDPATDEWENRRPMAVPRNHAFAGAVGGKIYVIGGRTGHGFILSASNTDVVEEYDPGTDMWSLPNNRMPTARSGGGWGSDGRRIYAAGGEVTTNQIAGAFRAVEAYEPATDSWILLPPMTMPRHGVAGGVIGNRFHLVSGMVQSSGAMTMFDPKLEVHTSAHDVMELPGGKAETKPEAKTEPATSSKAPEQSSGPAYTRYDVNSPEGQKMLAKYTLAVKAMRELPDHDTNSWNFWWYTHWIKGPPAHMWEESKEYKAQVVPLLPPASQALAEAVWNGCQAHPFNPDNPEQFQQWYFLPWHRLYLYHFERTIRNVLNDDDFTLPYWNPESGNLADLPLPAAFRDPSSPLFNRTRNTFINAGRRVDTPVRNWLTLDALNEEIYIDSPTGGVGFCTRLDVNPHFLTHVSIGGDMGNFATVGGDPIFYLHHSNLDRVWESWNRLGKTNPTDPKYLDRTFPFADPSGKRVDLPVSAADRVAQLGYHYDSYSKAPEPRTKPAGTAAEAAQSVAGVAKPVYQGPFGNSEGSDSSAKAPQPRVKSAAPVAKAPASAAKPVYQGPFGNSGSSVSISRAPEPRVKPGNSAAKPREPVVKPVYRGLFDNFENRTQAGGPPAAPAWSLPDGSGKSVSLDTFRGRPVVVIFYRGEGCLQCMEQLNNFGQKVRDFADAGMNIVAISTDAPAELVEAQAPYRKKGGFPFPVVSDAKLNVFKTYRCIDFDNQPLHGTFLIDAQGRVRWRDISDEPFNDPNFLLTQGRKFLSETAAR